MTSMVSTDVSEAEWDAFVQRQPDATGYHLWRWQHVFQQTFGHESCYLAVRSGGRLTGVLPLVLLQTWWFGRFGISLPYVNYGGVLAEDASSARQLLTAAAERGRSRGLSHLEFRHRRRQFPSEPLKQHKVTLLLPLEPTCDALWGRLDRKVRNQIRKAEKNELETATGGVELVDAFYEVFSTNMRDLGVPVHSKAFFSAVLAQFGEAARIHLVRRMGKPIAGGLTYRYKNVVEVPWASSLKEFLPMCPNNLLYWAIIRQAIAEGADTLDFGRSTPNEGTYHFKKQWGAVAHPLYWEYCLLSARSIPDTSSRDPRFHLAMNAWKRLPVRVAGAIGPALVRGMPY
jgi:FemAB-related protein (PEP-CTERM system-associated)